MNQITDQIIELRQSYNDLGEDLMLLESVVTAVQAGCEFPEECVASGLKRVVDYIRQHTGEVEKTSHILQKTAVLSRFTE